MSIADPKSYDLLLDLLADLLVEDLAAEEETNDCAGPEGHHFSGRRLRESSEEYTVECLES